MRFIYLGHDRRLIPEDMLRYSVLKSLEINFHLKLINILNLDNSLALTTLKSCNHLKIFVPSTVDTSVKVDAYIETFRKSLLLEFKSPCYYERNDAKLITGELRWDQIHFLNVIRSITIHFERRDVDLGYIVIPYPFCSEGPSSFYTNGLPNKDYSTLTSQRVDLMSIQSGDVEKHIFFVPTSSLSVIQNPDGLIDRNSKRKLYYNIWRVFLDGRICSRTRQECRQFQIDILSDRISFDEFILSLFYESNPGAKFTPITIYLINKFVQENGDIKKTLQYYDRIKKSKNLIKTIDSWPKNNIIQKELEPLKANLGVLKAWLNKLCLILIK